MGEDPREAQLKFFKSMAPVPSATSNHGLYVCSKYTVNKSQRPGCGNFISRTSVKQCKNIECQQSLCWYCPICNKVLTATFRSRHNNIQHNISNENQSSLSSKNKKHHPYERQFKKEKEPKSPPEEVPQLGIYNQTFEEIPEKVVPNNAVQAIVSQGTSNNNYAHSSETWVPILMSATPSTFTWAEGKQENVILVASNVAERIGVFAYKTLQEDKPEGELVIVNRLATSPLVKATDLHTIQLLVPHPTEPSSVYIAIWNGPTRVSNRWEIKFTQPITDTQNEVMSPIDNIPNYFFDELLQLGSDAQGYAWEGSYADLLGSVASGLSAEDGDGGLTAEDADGIQLLVAAVLGSNDKKCVILCLAYRFTCLGWVSKETFDQFTEVCKSNPDITEGHMMNEVCKQLNMAQFELVMDAVATHIKAIASSYGFDSTTDKIDMSDALICEDDESVPEGLNCGICQDTLSEPLISSCCKQLFCTTCINVWLAEGQPSCPTCRSPVNLENWTRASHLEKEKIYRKCQYCSGKFHWTAYRTHAEDCGSAIVKCKFGCANAPNLSKEMKVHHEEICATQTRECKSCNVTLRNDEFARHLESACMLAPASAKGKTPVEPVATAKSSPKKATGSSSSGVSLVNKIKYMLFGKIDDMLPVSSPDADIDMRSAFEDQDFCSNASPHAEYWLRKVAKKVQKNPPAQDVEQEIIQSLDVRRMSDWLKFMAFRNENDRFLDCRIIFGIYPQNDKFSTWVSQWNPSRFTPETHPFGNVHTVAIQIGCAILSWQPTSLVRVDRMVPENAVISLNLADVAHPVVNHETVFDKIAQIIVKWNGSRRYGLSRDTPQVFAKEILTGLQLTFQMPPKIAEYLQSVANGDIQVKPRSTDKPQFLDPEYSMSSQKVPSGQKPEDQILRESIVSR